MFWVLFVATSLDSLMTGPFHEVILFCYSDQGQAVSNQRSRVGPGALEGPATSTSAIDCGAADHIILLTLKLQQLFFMPQGSTLG